MSSGVKDQPEEMVPPRRRLSYVLAVSALWFAVYIAASMLPPHKWYFWVPITLVLLFRFPRGTGTSAMILSTVLWVLGFLLGCLVSAKSPFLWLPDLLLLVGFFPLFYMSKSCWWWIAFAFLTVVIDFGLLVIASVQVDLDNAVELMRTRLHISNLPPNFPQAVAATREHIVQMHDPMTWLRVGISTFLYGSITGVMDLVCWIKRITKRKQEQVC